MVRFKPLTKLTLESHQAPWIFADIPLRSQSASSGSIHRFQEDWLLVCEPTNPRICEFYVKLQDWEPDLRPGEGNWRIWEPDEIRTRKPWLFKRSALLTSQSKLLPAMMFLITKNIYSFTCSTRLLYDQRKLHGMLPRLWDSCVQAIESSCDVWVCTHISDSCSIFWCHRELGVCHDKPILAHS